MSKEKAQKAKELVWPAYNKWPHLLTAEFQGNAAFKAGDYPNAIGHYTAAILAEKDDVTFYLNRAAAYLKLGKCVLSQRTCAPRVPTRLLTSSLSNRDADAENDCTKALGLSEKNVKGLFRRGQARIGLGKLKEAQNGIYYTWT